MTRVDDARAVYRTLGAHIAAAVRSDGFAARMRQVDRTVQFALTNPAATITARCKRDHPLDVTFGATGWPIDIRIRAPFDAVHSLFLGELNVFLALDRGEIAIDGDPTPFLALLPQIQTLAAPAYRATLEARPSIRDLESTPNAARTAQRSGP